MNPLSKIKIEWSPNFAYAIGLLATDGSLSKDGRHIAFVSKDKQQVITFKKCLGLKTKLSTKSSGSVSEKLYFHTQFGDINFYRWLLTIGITPNKSKTIRALDIPDKYFPDFLRGHFDGDGCFYQYRDKRWRSSFMFYMNFGSASRQHVEWLQARINELWGIHGHTTISNKMWMLRYAKKESRILISKLYYRPNLPYLQRKKDKIKKFVDIHIT